MYTSFIKLWPYDLSFSTRHYVFGLIDGGVIDSYFNSLKMALLAAVLERAAPGSADPADMLFVPFRIRQSAGPDLTFFSTVVALGTALDVTMAELAIESLFPADEATNGWLKRAG